MTALKSSTESHRRAAHHVRGFCSTLVKVSLAVLVMESAACSGDSGSTSDTGGSASVTGGSVGTGGSLSGTGGSSSGGSAASGGATVSSTGGESSGGSPAAGGTDGGSGGVSTGGTSGAATGGADASGAGGAVAGFAPCPAQGATCNILPLGDSITEGCCTQPMGGYRIEFYRQALMNKKDTTFVGTLTNGPDMVDGQPFQKKHEGHGGWKISQIAGVVDNVIASSDPHIVLLKIGTNDINGNDDINNAPKRLRSLIDQIVKDAPSALLVVSAIIPTTNDGTNQKVTAYNAAIKVEAEAAAAEGKHVVFLDNYTVFTDQANYKTALMVDSLHPNDAGYKVLGQSFYDLVSELLPDSQ